MIRKKRRRTWTSKCRHLPSSRSAPRPSPARETRHRTDPKPPGIAHRTGRRHSTAPPAPGPPGPSPFTLLRSLLFVCPFGFPREPRSRQRILQGIDPYAPYSRARGRSRGGVPGLEHASLRPRLVCAALSRRGCHGKAAPGKPVGATARITCRKYARRTPASWMALRRTLRRTVESAKSLKSRACVCTGTRPTYGRVTERTRLFHCASG